MEKKRVSIVRFAEKRENIRRAIQMCGGLADLKAADRVLIKPNLVMWDGVYPFPKYGVITTSVVMEEIVKALKEAGCGSISIGEGTIEDRETASSTRAAFAGLGYEKLEHKYGVKLIDFNDGPYVKTDMDGFSLNISSHALEADYLINVPVLKTHNSTRVSLGFKNLKGCLDQKSRMFCHHKTRPLEGFIRRLGETIAPRLTVIDGIYALEKGPAVNGRACRADVLVASRDMFAADLVGARLLGFAPADIPYLQEYGLRHGLSLEGSGIQVLGERVEDAAVPLDWDWEWQEDDSGPPAFARLGISGIHYPKYDSTLCSGCSFLNNLMLILLMEACRGKACAGLEFLGGKRARSQGGHRKTFLFGSCAIRENRDNPAIGEGIAIKGCPPTAREIVKALRANGIPADLSAYMKYRTYLAERYKKRPEFVEGHFTVQA